MLNAVERVALRSMKSTYENILNEAGTDYCDEYYNLFEVGETALRQLIIIYITTTMRPQRVEIIENSEIAVVDAGKELTRIDAYLTNQGIDTKTL